MTAFFRLWKKRWKGKKDTLTEKQEEHLTLEEMKKILKCDSNNTTGASGATRMTT